MARARGVDRWEFQCTVCVTSQLSSLLLMRSFVEEAKSQDNLFVGERVFPTHKTCLKEAGGGWRHEGIYE